MRKIIAVLIILIVTQALPAQIYLAVPFLEMRPSANLFSNGGAYAALPTNDPAGFYCFSNGSFRNLLVFGIRPD